jgi:cysteine desulfurase/selenocysteine lyase
MSTPNGALDPQAVIDAIGPRTKLVAITHLSNVLGTVVDVKAICAARMRAGVPVLVDGSQAAVHMPVDVPTRLRFLRDHRPQALRPLGVGRDLCPARADGRDAPFIGGGDMIREVTQGRVIYNDPPMKFEAGTPGIVQTDRPRRGARLHDGLGMERSPPMRRRCATMRASGSGG